MRDKGGERARDKGGEREPGIREEREPGIREETLECPTPVVMIDSYANVVTYQMAIL